MKKLTLKKGVKFEIVEPSLRYDEERIQQEIKEGYVKIHFEDDPILLGKWDGYRMPISIFNELTKETEDLVKRKSKEVS
jgi:hypothetical protein